MIQPTTAPPSALANDSNRYSPIKAPIRPVRSRAASNGTNVAVCSARCGLLSGRSASLLPELSESLQVGWRARHRELRRFGLTGLAEGLRFAEGERRGCVRSGQRSLNRNEFRRRAG